ncbi:imelysin family protein [Marinobacter caseinilyticus]|uniref:imelysin family protein n=1 Tax=Marinobacter caseinilyticus TaxID=2692195 RepID=UPI001407F593|nr:imelysin family protein [Marinobacter caseinilyticus]
MRNLALSLSASAFLLLAGCDAPKPPTPTVDDTLSSAEPFPEAIRNEVMAQTGKVCDATVVLKDSTAEFLDNPDADTLTAAQTQWAAAHRDYTQLMALYTVAGTQPLHIRDDRDSIDAYPMLPGYLDRVPGYPRSGLVYSEVPLTPDFLREEHQYSDFYYLTLGFHPLETMLWGSAEQSAKERAALYTRKEQVPEDQVDSHTRRAELLRLIAHRLTRDVAVLCQPNSQTHLMAELTTVVQHRADLLNASRRALKTMVQSPLSQWSAHPDGEDRNGMPIWHAPLARSDFDNMRTQVAALNDHLLPLMFAAGNMEPKVLESLTATFSALDQRLDAHANAGSEQKQEALEVTLAHVNDLIQALELPAATSAESENDSEKTGQ